MLRVIGIVAVCAAVGWCAPWPPEARAGERESAERPVLLLIAGGGFIFEVDELRYPARAARRLGFRTRIVSYPDYDLPGAVRAARRAARRAGRGGADVYAYGESAGGTLAALLAEDGLAAAATTYCPIAELADFLDHSWDPDLYQALIRASDRDLRAYSPGLHDSRRPILALRAIDDAPHINQAIRRWDRRDRDARSRAVAGDHLGDPRRPRVYRRNVDRGLAWLARPAGLRSPSE